MPISDISRASRSLANLLRINLTRLTGDAITSSAMIPSQVEGVSRRVNVYLYHLRLDPFFITPNQPAGAPHALRETPAKFILYYIITAHHNAQSGEQSVPEQLIGLSLKTLRDFMKIEDSTEIAGQVVMDGEILGLDNRFEIHLPNPEESMSSNFWNSDPSSGIRPALYCELRNVLIIPEASEQFDLPILSLGTEVQPNFGPVLRVLSSEMAVEIPVNNAMEVRVLQNPQSRVLIGAGTPSNRLVLHLFGDFHSGQFRLEMPNAFAIGEQPLDFSIQNPDWLLQQEGQIVEITFGSDLQVETGGVQVSHALTPGTYKLLFVENREIEHSNGVSVHEIKSQPLTLHFSPYIESHSRAGAVLEFTLSGNFALNLADMDLTLAVNRIRYVFADDVDNLNEGEFGIEMPASRTLRVHLTATARDTGLHSLQFWMFGESSQPYWYEV